MCAARPSLSRRTLPNGQIVWHLYGRIAGWNKDADRRRTEAHMPYYRGSCQQHDRIIMQGPIQARLYPAGAQQRLPRRDTARAGQGGRESRAGERDRRLRRWLQLPLHAAPVRWAAVGWLRIRGRRAPRLLPRAVSRPPPRPLCFGSLFGWTGAQTCKRRHALSAQGSATKAAAERRADRWGRYSGQSSRGTLARSHLRTGPAVKI
jgi:hypothetical protein